MQDRDDPLAEVGETGGGVAVVPPTVAGTAVAVIANSMAEFTPPPWITATARPLAETDRGLDDSAPVLRPPTRRQSLNLCHNGKMPIRAFSRLSMTYSSWRKFRRPRVN